MPVAALLPRYAPDTPFPEVWGVFRCSTCGSKRIDARPNWVARRAPGQITRPRSRPSHPAGGFGDPRIELPVTRVLLRRDCHKMPLQAVGRLVAHGFDRREVFGAD